VTRRQRKADSRGGRAAKVGETTESRRTRRKTAAKLSENHTRTGRLQWGWSTFVAAPIAARPTGFVDQLLLAFPSPCSQCPCGGCLVPLRRWWGESGGN